MAIYVIADLHLAFNEDKPMNIFGDNWKNHTKKIKEDWLEKVEQDDTVVLPGDFSWSMKLNDTIKDFQYLKSLPGKKILLKGNHDYWWTTIKSMKQFLNDNDFENIEFLFNNSFEREGKILCGTRGWTTNNLDETENNKKMVARECNRLKMSIEDGINNFGEDEEVVIFMHYPPIMQANIVKNETTPFMEILKQYKIKRCYYGHLHGKSIEEAVTHSVDGIELNLISADGVDFKLQKV